MLIAGAGGAVTLLAFLALPHITLPIFGGVTMPTVIGLLTRLEPGWGYLWLVPAAAFVVAVCGLWLGASATVGPAARLRLTGSVESLSFFVGLAYVLVPFALADGRSVSLGTSAQFTTTFLDVGYYVGALGMVAAFISSAATARELRLRRREARS